MRCGTADVDRLPRPANPIGSASRRTSRRRDCAIVVDLADGARTVCAGRVRADTDGNLSTRLQTAECFNAPCIVAGSQVPRPTVDLGWGRDSTGDDPGAIVAVFPLHHHAVEDAREWLDDSRCRPSLVVG